MGGFCRRHRVQPTGANMYICMSKGEGGIFLSFLVSLIGWYAIYNNFMCAYSPVQPPLQVHC